MTIYVTLDSHRNMGPLNITQQLGASVRRLRVELGLSQEELAGRADLHRTYIAGIESGARNLTLRSMEKLARALGVTPSGLLHEADQPREARGDGGIERSGRDILFVEDQADDVELTLEAFREAGITNPVHVARDGSEALDYLFCTGRHSDRPIGNRPQLVLLDLDLPKVSGLDVLRRMRASARTRSIPVAVLTGSRNSQELAECRKSGAQIHIIKPVGLLGLSKATRQLNLGWALHDLLGTDAGEASLQTGAEAGLTER